MNTQSRIAGRSYIMGEGILNTRGRICIHVVDVSADKIVSTHSASDDAVKSMIGYAHSNNIRTQLALASDFGTDLPLIISETY